jgi:probable metal-binding protein
MMSQTTEKDTQIHGHEVLRMMMEAGHGFTKAGLIQTIEERFGKSARFCTCSAEGLDAAGLVAFLEARGKFMPMSGDQGGFTADESKMCAG